MANEYEVTYILRPSLEESEVDTRVTALAESVAKLGGEVSGEIEKLGKRRLAYEIDDVREGYYVVMHYRLSSEGQKELERQMGLNEAVMRFLPIRKEPGAVRKPNPLMPQAPPPMPPPGPAPEPQSVT